MQGSFCRFYVHENDRHQGRLLWEWLLDLLRREKVKVFYALIPARFGVIDPE